MSTQVIINRWDGGIAEDVRTEATNECESNANFDIFTNPHKLIPYSDPVAETSSGTITDYTITDVAILNVSGVATVYGMGRNALGVQNVEILKKSSTSDITSAWSLIATNSNELTPGTLVEYHDKLCFMAGGSSFHTFTPPSTITVVSTLVGPYTTNFSPKPFRHPIDDALYVASGNLVYKYTGVSPYTTPTLMHTLAVNFEIQSFTDFGNYLAIGGNYLTNNKKSAVYLSNKDVLTPNALPAQVIDWGEGKLAIIENIGGVIAGISYMENIGSYTTINTFKLMVKIYSGGTVQTIKEIVLGGSSDVRVWKAKNSNKLYFGFDADNAMYVLAKNKSGYWVVTKDRYYNPSGSFLNGASGLFTGLSFVGDISFTSYGDGTTDGYLARQGTSTAYTLPSVYTTTINPGMNQSDRYVPKKLKAVQIAYKCNTTNGNITLGYYVDGSNLQTIINTTQATAGEYVTHTFKDTSGLPFIDGYEYKFYITTTGNVEVKELRYKYDLMTQL